jgi:rhodanese-related sulfurtransferase
MTTTPSPFRKALREARGIILAAIFVAVAYNLFASTAVPWMAAPPPADSVPDSTVDTWINRGTATPAVTTPADTTTLTPTDTAATASGAEAKRLKDSTDKAILAEKRRVQDSINQYRKNHPVVVNGSTDPVVNIPPPAPVVDATKHKEVSTAQAKKLFDSKAALFIDARPADQFDKGHIPGAINVYANEFQNQIPMLLKYLNENPNQLIVAYCGGGLCELSHDLATQLLQLKFTNVVVYTGGTGEWKDQFNYPFTGE